MLAWPESEASAAPTTRETCPANGMPRRARAAIAKVRLARQLAVHLDEVDAESDERIDGRGRVGGSLHQEMGDRLVAAFEIGP
jgi:hypothetical protein